MGDTKGDVDRVQIASRHPDGTPAQTPDFEFIGNKDFAIEASKKQLAEQAVSATDTALRGPLGLGGTSDQGNEPDENVQKLIDAHEAAVKGAHSQAESEVNAKFKARPTTASPERTTRTSAPENTAART